MGTTDAAADYSALFAISATAKQGVVSNAVSNLLVLYKAESRFLGKLETT